MRSMNKGRRAFACGALAALMVVAVAAEAAGPAPATVRVTRPVAGRVVLDVANDTVTLRKDITADRSVVTLTTERERVSIIVRRGTVSVASGGETLVADAGAGTDASRLSEFMKRSDAVTRGRKLLATVTEGPETFAGQSLLLTRAILEMGTGDGTALAQHQQWVAAQAAQKARQAQWQAGPRVLRAAYLVGQQRGPGDCWDLYHKEAIRIAEDFAECTDGLKWYEAHLWAACSLIYAVRSEGAMAWYIACNGGVPFNG